MVQWAQLHRARTDRLDTLTAPNERCGRGWTWAGGSWMKLSIAYITASSSDQARRIGRALVQARLAACVNIIPGMNSVYAAARTDRDCEIHPQL
jgi:fatty-acid desaturase